MYRGFNANAYQLLAVSSLRRLLPLRADPYARKQAHAWLRDLRQLRRLAV